MTISNIQLPTWCIYANNNEI